MRVGAGAGAGAAAREEEQGTSRRMEEAGSVRWGSIPLGLVRIKPA